MPDPYDSELHFRIALTMVPSVGPVTAMNLIKEFGSAREVFSRGKKDFQEIKGIGPELASSLTGKKWLELASSEMKFLARHRIAVCCFGDADYPRRLSECKDAPFLLYTRGNQGLCSPFVLSVVGTRRATSYGRNICRQLILDLSRMVKGLVIVSGLAYGIDVIAHKAALEAGIPTLAVLGHGFKTIYPSAHREVAKEIMNQGCLVTDFHSNTGPERNNFLRRNRIIAGLADATLVVESAEEGGALITADLADSYNRYVLAVPGRITDERSKGCNALIKDCKAAMVESASDVLYHLNRDPDPSGGDQNPLPEDKPGREERLLLQLMVDEPGIKPEKMSHRAGIPIQQVLSTLVQMELNNWIMVEPGYRYHCRIPLS